MSTPSLSSSPISLQDGFGAFNEDSLSEDEVNFNPLLKWDEVKIQSNDLFENGFEQHEEVGKGRFGIVYKVSEKGSGKKRAAKIIKCIKADDRAKVKEEISIMNDLRHPKLLQLLAAFERRKDFVMIMEYISGGELFERVVADDFSLTERDCALFIRQICEGVEYMHENSIVHLDLKPENILCVSRNSHKIKLIDFGLARKLDPEKPCRVLFGTPEFVAPEVINFEPISFASDMWSVGVICYVLLSGLSPFMGENDPETFANITLAEFDFDDDSFEAISDDAKSFITNLLDKRKEKRPSAEKCLETGWLSKKEGLIGDVVLSTVKLKRFIIRRKWQKTGNAIRALGRMATLTNQRNASPTRYGENKSPIPPLSQTSSTSGISYLASKSTETSNKTSTSIVNERSDSGISECSTVTEDRLNRSCTSIVSQTNNSGNVYYGIAGSGKAGPGLAWQLSIDSAVEEEEDTKSVFSPRRPSKDGLLPVNEISANTHYESHSRV